MDRVIIRRKERKVNRSDEKEWRGKGLRENGLKQRDGVWEKGVGEG